MTEKEAQDILERIAVSYSRFKITEMTVEVWVKQLLKMDYGHVLYNLEKYIVTEKWPPTIADIAAFPRKKNEHLEKVEKWKRESLYAKKHRS